MTGHRGTPRRWLLALAAVIVTSTAIGPYALAQPTTDVPHVWVYSGTQNFRHASIPHAKDVLGQLAESTGRFTVEFTEEPADLTADMLARTDVALFLSPSGIRNQDNSENAPFTAAQRALFEQWISCGGGFVGVHQAADSYDDWPAWDEVVGAKFLIHQITPAGTEPATVNVNDQTHVTTKPWHGQQSFTLSEEYYAWLPDRTPDQMTTDFNQLLGFGSFTNPVLDATWGSIYEDNQALAWTSTFRSKNRSFYTNLGHAAATWDLPAFREHVVNGITWVAAVRPGDTCGEKTARS